MAPRETDDVAALRAFAHPVRLRLLSLLRLDGPATASALARRTGESSGSTSYHLRQLARFGLVEDAEGAATRRERLWRARGHAAGAARELLETAAGRRETERAVRMQVSAWLEQVTVFLADPDHWGPAWSRPALSTSARLRLSSSDFAALSAELTAAVDRFRDREPRSRATEVVEVYVGAVPTTDAPRPDAPPRRRARRGT